jgi:hypothetical protein
MHTWYIDQDIDSGRLAYLGQPRFTARWTTGDLAAVPEAMEGPCWCDTDGAGADDAICLYGFAWPDGPPDQAQLEVLMGQAVRAIDAWIAEQL